MHTENIRITYSRWLFNTHLVIIVAVLARYIASLTIGPLLYTIGTLRGICLLLVLSYHIIFFVSLNYKPALFEQTVIFHSPFAWAAIWLLVFYGENRDALDTANSTVESPIRSFLDRRIGPLMLLAMHAFVWYMRRTVIGVTVFERKIRASLISYRCYRIYTVLAVPLIVLVWKWYPHVSALLESYVYLSLDNQIEDPINYFRGSAMTRVGIGGRRLVAAMLVSGGTHVLWYSFISYAYHAVVWKEYLREGLAIWVVGNGTMCTKLN